MSRLTRSERGAEEMAEAVSKAAQAFEGRWTKLALRRENPDLADRLNRQQWLWDTARRDGDADEVLKRGQGMLRGYAACTAIMAAVEAPEDAYDFGQASDGRLVSFGPAAAAQRIAERFPGQMIPHYTLDEAAEILLAVKTVSTVKAVFPGAEVVAIRKREKADG